MVEVEKTYTSYLQIRVLGCDLVHVHRLGDQGFLGKFWNPRARESRAPVPAHNMGES